MSANEKSLELSSRPAAAAYISRVCFKVGPPQLIGAELEWLTRTADGRRPSLQITAAALGEYAPRSIAPESPALTLPGGSAVTIEPGGQVELSSSPHASVSELARALDSDANIAATLMMRAGIAMESVPADRDRGPERVLQLPRYCAMENHFTSIGPYGALMMCSTAAVQVSVDAGVDLTEIARRWEMLHAIGPAFVAAFARSPVLHGAPAGKWASQRMRTWLELDGHRTTVPNTGNPVDDYAQWALDVPLLCIRSDGENWQAPAGVTFADWLDAPELIGRTPTVADLDYHLTTLFPPVRACGHLEIRYVDAQPEGMWVVPAAAFEALLATPAVTAAATRLAHDTRDRWSDAARNGLADADFRDAAAQLLGLASENGGEHRGILADAAERCRRGHPPVAPSRHATSSEHATNSEHATKKESV